MTNRPTGETVSTIGMDAKPFSWVPLAVTGQGKLVSYKEPDRLLESCIAIAKNAQQETVVESAAKADKASEGNGNSTSTTGRSTFPSRVRSIVDSFSPRAGNASSAAQPRVTPTAGSVQYDDKLVTSYMDENRASGDGGSFPVVVSCLDLGGQDNFYAFHPYFFTRDGVIFVVFNMTHLHTSAAAEETSEALDYIKRWINAIMVGIDVRYGGLIS